MKYTTVFARTLNASKSGALIIGNQGGTRSGKTFSTLQILLLWALPKRSDDDMFIYRDPLGIPNKKPLISIVSESLPHLKKGAIRDFQLIVDDLGLVKDKHYTYNKTDQIYAFKEGGTIEFFSADSPGKVHGPQRDILFVNECNHIPWEIINQLMIRTSGLKIFDWNPARAFWWTEQGIKFRKGSVTLQSTYLDNGFLSAVQVGEIEANKHNENWWRVYGLGLEGKLEGLVYTNWEVVDEYPNDVKSEWGGLDFGFTADPTTLVRVGLVNGELWLDEQIYRKGLLNNEIADGIRQSGMQGLDIVADSAEQKSIAEIKAYGIGRIEGAEKGPDSILAGIQILQRYKINVTARSTNIIKELNSYMWMTDKISGVQLNKPCDAFNHALDAVRYVALNKLKKTTKKFKKRSHAIQQI